MMLPPCRSCAGRSRARGVVGTVLLGSAILIQITGPASFPVDPFFFLIGLTYALTSSTR